MLNEKKYFMLKKVYTSFMLITGLTLVMINVPSCTTKDVYTNAVRLHVIANSDEDVDQKVKLKVRDQIVEELGETLANMPSETASFEYLLNNSETVEEIAQKVLVEQGFVYGANVDIGIHDYPTRMYEEATLPAGEYRSVKVILGKGTGKNWWCVIYPPMCVSTKEEEEKQDDVLIETKDIEEEDDIMFRSVILEKLGIKTPQPKEKAKSRLLKWLDN